LLAPGLGIEPRDQVKCNTLQPSQKDHNLAIARPNFDFSTSVRFNQQSSSFTLFGQPVGNALLTEVEEMKKQDGFLAVLFLCVVF